MPTVMMALASGPAGASPAAATRSASSTPPAVLRGVDLGTAEPVTVRLRLSRAAEPVTKTLPPSDGRPGRIYVDLPGAVVSAGAVREVAGQGAVRMVRIGQFDPSTARVVLDLASPQTIVVDRDGTDVTLRLQPAGAAPAVAHRAAPQAVSLTPPAAETRKHVDDPVAQLRREVAERRVAGDRPGVVASYATWGAATASRLDAMTRAGVADTLREVGLLQEAGRVLGDDTPSEAPVLRIARAELALASGDTTAARRVLDALDATPPSGMIAEPLARLRAHVALADGDLDTATAVTREWPNPSLVTEVARAGLAAGRAATAARSWDRARVAYDTVLNDDVDGALRSAAAAGLMHVALANGDHATATRARDVLATAADPTLRRAALALGAEWEEEGR